MHVNDKVTIFTDPISRQVPEGEAVLIELLNGDCGQVLGSDDQMLTLERWRVAFVGDSEPVDRVIAVRETLVASGGAS